MQKLLPILLTLATLAGQRAPGYAQHAFLDAQSLRNVLTSIGADGKVHLPNQASFFTLADPYVPTADRDNDNAIINDFSTNPFIVFDAVRVEAAFRAPAISEAGSISSLNITNIANGVAALMVDRAKQELTITFFQRFQKFADQHHEFGLLFPATTGNLGKLLTFSYPQVLPILRNGFFADLKSLPAHLPGLLDIDPYAKIFANYPELRIAIRSLQYVGDIQSGASTPAEVLDEFAQLKEWGDKANSPLMNNLGATAKLAALISNSLRSSTNDQPWVTPKDLKPLLTDQVLQKIYLGLLWQSAKRDMITFYPKPGQQESLPSLLAGLQNKVQPLLTRITQFTALAGQIDNAFNTIKSNNQHGNANTNADYYNYIGVAIDAIDTVFGTVDLFYPNLDAKPYLNLSRTGNALYKDIYSEQYTQAVSDAMDVLVGIGKLAGVYTPVLPAAAKDAKTTAKQKKNALQDLAAFVEKVKPFVLFMANLAEANTSSDVQAALDNAILPVGSSSIKKNTRFNVAIQTYLGAYAVTSHTGSNVNGMWADKFGVTAPIGFSITPGFTSLGKYGSISLFAEVFDLGAIVDYQLKTDTVTNSSGSPTAAVSKSYSIQLGQILSPGGYIVYGAGANLPLALGFGGQYGPGLSSIKSGSQTIVTNPSWRWNFFLTVDLPFFNLWNVNKTKQ